MLSAKIKKQVFLRTDSEDSDKTGRMPRLICVFVGRTGYFVGFYHAAAHFTSP